MKLFPRTHCRQKSNSWSCLYQSQRTALCYWSLLCNDHLGPGRGGSSRGQRCNWSLMFTPTVSDDRFIEWTWLYKEVYCMYSSSTGCPWTCADCWLLEWVFFFLGGRQETGMGRNVVPILLKQCFAQAWWILPYCFFLFGLCFPWVGGVERGVCCWTEGQEELRTMTKRKITFPLEEKNKTEKYKPFCVVIYLQYT